MASSRHPFPRRHRGQRPAHLLDAFAGEPATRSPARPGSPHPNHSPGPPLATGTNTANPSPAKGERERQVRAFSHIMRSRPSTQPNATRKPPPGRCPSPSRPPQFSCPCTSSTPTKPSRPARSGRHSSPVPMSADTPARPKATPNWLICALRSANVQAGRAAQIRRSDSLLERWESPRVDRSRGRERAGEYSSTCIGMRRLDSLTSASC
jgi:hypothetical protein